MSEFLMKPKIDFAFKEIMMNENARIGFLSAVLKLNPAEIKETTILDTSLQKEFQDDKQGILFVRMTLSNNTEIDVEILLSRVNAGTTDRSLFYLFKMYTGQTKSWRPYIVLRKCVSISVLDFSIFQGETEFYSCFHFQDDAHHQYTDQMEFHVIELPKLPNELKEDSDDILLWAKFINAEKKEEFEMLAARNAYIESAYKTLQVISQDKEKRWEYEVREKAIHDYNQGMLEAEERGRMEEKETTAKAPAGIQKI